LPAAGGDSDGPCQLHFTCKKNSVKPDNCSGLTAVLHKQKTTSNAQEFIKVWKMSNTRRRKQQKHFATVSRCSYSSDNKDWNRFIVGTISNLAAPIFDNGQAILVRSGSAISGLFMAWKQKPL